MKMTFDPAKDKLNKEQHGVSLATASELDWDMMLQSEDRRFNYGEQRFIGFAPFANRVYCVVFTERNDSIRVISLRKANRREVLYYASQIEQ